MIESLMWRSNAECQIVKISKGTLESRGSKGGTSDTRQEYKIVKSVHLLSA